MYYWVRYSSRKRPVWHVKKRLNVLLQQICRIFLQSERNLRGPHAAIDRYPLPAPELISKPAGRRCCCRSTGQTDGHSTRNVRRILVRGVNSPLPPENLTTKWCILKYIWTNVVRIAPFSTPACPHCSQNINIENCSFCTFSLFNFSSIFHGGQLTPFAPMCGRPCTRLFYDSPHTGPRSNRSKYLVTTFVKKHYWSGHLLVLFKRQCPCPAYFYFLCEYMMMMIVIHNTWSNWTEPGVCELQFAPYEQSFTVTKQERLLLVGLQSGLRVNWDLNRKQTNHTIT